MIGIQVHVNRSDQHVEIHQSRPAVTSVLIGRPVDEALANVQRLLPICGRAQTIAATRAVEVARGDVAGVDTRRRRARALDVECAMSMAWRLTLDWPNRFGTKPNFPMLKSIRSIAEEAVDLATKSHADELAERLSDCMPEFRGAKTVAEFCARLENATGTIAVAWQEARRLDDTVQATAHPVMAAGDPDRSWELARNALSVPDYDQLRPSMPSPVDLGPLATSLDPRVQEISHQDIGPLSARLLAMLLDTQHTIARLQRSHEESAADVDEPFSVGMTSPGGLSIGAATTARGLVFHAIRLDGEIVSDWRVLAPTDWHFAPDGAVAAVFRALPVARWDRRAGEVVLAAFDPCAECSIIIS